ncbi:MAG: hypothetical protein ABSF95_05220 [Verrucomicrobiota bacterium]|jgi:hypothetical protein
MSAAVHPLFILGLFAAANAAAAAQGTVVIENAHVSYTVSPGGKNLGFVDRATGLDYLRRGAASPCALVRREGKEYPATGAALANGRLSLRFGDAGVEAVLKVEPRPSCVRLTVESIPGADIESLVFLNLPLALEGKPDEPFGACAFSLNLITRVDQLPALQSELRAAAHKKFGILGAKVALVGVPMNRVLPALKEVLSEADEMPLCTVAGPWAREAPLSHGSYLFNFGSLTEATLDDWIQMASSLGFTQIDNHGGSPAFFRFGDFELNRQKWPEGWETYRRIVARLHAAGIASIFHTYAFFLDKHSKYVTPIPDQRLDAFRTFTLADKVTADTDELPVNESTAAISTVTGFFEQNSLVLHLGDELAAFGGASRQPPWRFTAVKRGVFGTKPAAHDQGAKARHLKECFGLFVPDPESPLFAEIAANHAEVVNCCDFDGIYLDAIDGASILRGGDECWYWADKFVFEIQKRLKKPVGMEMSAMWHHFWQYRTRWQAWDYPQRGHKRFIDLHAQALNGGLLLPLHLGWWNFQSFNPPQVEPTFPDVLECLGARLIGWDAGISLTGAVDRNQLQTVPLYRRAVDIIRTCEAIRHSGALDEQTKAKLREPGREFSLLLDDTGQPRFRPAHSLPHTAALAEPWSLSWPATNPFPQQPVKLRLEALMSAAPYDDPTAIIIADLSGQGAAGWNLSAADGVVASLDSGPAGTNAPGALLQAANSGKVPRHAAWARCRKQFSPALNLKERQALGLWLEGDGLGELLAVRLESPQYLAFGALADRYVTVDFTGRRLFSLVETESARWSDYAWDDGKGVYNAYRETIDFGAVESVGVWYQNLPPGKEVKCRLGPAKALPMLPQTMQDPALTVNGTTILFPLQMASGSWLECNAPDDCLLYGSKGESLGRVTPRGPWPTLRPGENQLHFSCAPIKGPSPRAKVTLFTYGPPL